MKIYISADIEGISGVVSKTHTSQQGSDYARARKLMTNEVNAAIEGALGAGATEIVVNDSHGPMTNILIEDLNPAAKLITGTPKPLSMMEGINSTFNAAIFVGYHSRMNTPGVLSHSYHGGVISNISINGIDVGEFGFNAFVAGYYRVPVIAVTGDNILAEEVYKLNDQVTSIVVKTVHSRFSAQCIHPSIVRTKIEEDTKRALINKNNVPICEINGPIDLEVTFMNSAMAEMAWIIPGTEKTAPNRIYFRAKNIVEAYRARMAMTSIASTLL